MASVIPRQWNFSKNIMRVYVVKRLLQTFLTLLIVATLLFGMFRVLPGKATAQVISPALSQPAQERLKEIYGLDEPPVMQYLLYLRNLVTFQWGRSFTTKQKVVSMISYRFWNTVIFMGIAMFFTMTLGILLGIFTAWKRGTLFDKVTTVGVLITRSSPPFVTGLILLIVLSYRLRLFPTGGMHSPGFGPQGIFATFFNFDFLMHLILPVITATSYYIATILLIMRKSMLEVLGSDFIEMARFKGLSTANILFKHGARNALLAVTTVAALTVGFAIGGQVVIEKIFSWPGMGRLLVDAASAKDYPVAQTGFFLMAFVVITMNLVADIAYAYLDPRIKYG